MLAADSKAASGTGTRTLKPEPSSSWKTIIDPIEPFLDAVARRLAREVDAFDPAIAPYADYALNGQGKHLRPALVSLTANVLGQASEAHVTVAVIIEMVHLATLVHDDVMDEAEIRRGRLTLAANWGNEIAVLFGDCLFAQALKLAASFPTPEICRAVAMATNTVCSGEILQTQHRRDFALTREEYFKILERKSADLFCVFLDLGAFLGGTAWHRRAALRRLGLAFGTAYQIYDDCVDVFGSETVAGKSLGTDLAKGKLTLPVLLAWERAKPGDRIQLEHLVQRWGNSSMEGISELLRRYQTQSSSLKVIHDYLDTARRALCTLPGSVGRDGLLGLTEYLGCQAHILGAPA